MKLNNKSGHGEQGFTLVELAIVMIIIGLLIGGILKGQELIANARLASAISKVKAIDAAMNTFQDTYNGKPGDITQASVRLPNCTTDRCAANGNGNGRIDTTGPDASQDASSENARVWAQLASTDLLGGVRNAATSDNAAGGVTNPNAEVPGQIFIGYAANSGALLLETSTIANIVRSGHYLAIYNGSASAPASAAASADTVSLTPSQAARIDQKMDDGAPNTGSVLAMGAVDATTGCASTADAAGLYVGSNGSTACGIYVRVQQ